MVLIGVFESELRDYLVASGTKDGLKFAFANRGMYVGIITLGASLG